jgi:hypothetical protein
MKASRIANSRLNKSKILHLPSSMKQSDQLPENPLPDGICPTRPHICVPSAAQLWPGHRNFTASQYV